MPLLQKLPEFSANGQMKSFNPPTFSLVGRYQRSRSDDIWEFPAIFTVGPIKNGKISHLFSPSSPQAAEAICTFGYSDGAEAEPRIFVGKTAGCIVEPRGPRDFGWGTLFLFNLYINLHLISI